MNRICCANLRRAVRTRQVRLQPRTSTVQSILPLSPLRIFSNGARQRCNVAEMTDCVDPAMHIEKAIVSCNFDAGNIEVESIVQTETDLVCELKLRAEPFTEGTDKRAHKQWFYFKVSNARALQCTFIILDGKESSYPEAWPGTWAVKSSDLETWVRTPTTYAPETGKITISVEKGDVDCFYVSYFAPYSYHQHQQLVTRCQGATNVAGTRISRFWVQRQGLVKARCQSLFGCRIETIGRTLQGRDLDLIVAGTGKLVCWFIARQHPGESMSEWWMDGFLARLLDATDPVSIKVLQAATIYVVPNMNPDGAVLGHLRTNACGANLNREWASTGDHVAPSLERSPEVHHVLDRMTSTGCDFFLDVHGDEELPHIFIAGEMGIPNFSERYQELYRTLCESQLKAFPAFQLKHHYGNDAKNEANLAIAAAHVSSRFDCLGCTMEMPYKDTWDLPEPIQGWSSDRSIKLGKSMVEVLHEMLPLLRASFPFGNGGIGDGGEVPDWCKHGYENPPSQHCWDTTPPSSTK